MNSKKTIDIGFCDWFCATRDSNKCGQTLFSFFCFLTFPYRYHNSIKTLRKKKLRFLVEKYTLLVKCYTWLAYQMGAWFLSLSICYFSDCKVFKVSLLCIRYFFLSSTNFFKWLSRDCARKVLVTFDIEVISNVYLQPVTWFVLSVLLMILMIRYEFIVEALAVISLLLLSWFWLG